MEMGAQVLVKMDALLAGWRQCSDRRAAFLLCYRMMTQNVWDAIRAGEFEDTPWVAMLMERFAGYYFRALSNHEEGSGEAPEVWRIAFQAAQNPQTRLLQNLLLGVNAHINDDLVFAVAELLSNEWAQLSATQRQSRYRDYCRINQIIQHTIDGVQDQIINPEQPLWGVVDRLLGPVDEWLISALIRDWREEVWQYATRLLDLAGEAEQAVIQKQVHSLSLARARNILGQGSLAEWADFF